MVKVALIFSHTIIIFLSWDDFSENFEYYTHDHFECILNVFTLLVHLYEHMVCLIDNTEFQFPPRILENINTN